MILIDVNLLLYAYDKASPHNEAAAEWLEQVMSEQELVGLPWATILAFLRISTHPRAPKPLPLSVAIDTMREWLLRPSVSIVHPGERHWSILSQLLPGIAGARRTGDGRPLSRAGHRAWRHSLHQRQGFHALRRPPHAEPPRFPIVAGN